MATRQKDEPQSDGKGRIKFRYTDAERTLDFTVENVTGGQVTESLRSLANALAGRTIVGEGRQPKAALPAPSPAGQHEEVATPEPEVPEEEEVEIVEPEAGDGLPKPRRVAKPKAPKLLSSPKLTDAKVPLEEFMKQKNPDAMWDKYAVVAVWLKDEFQITEISIDHIFTAFKHLGWESQLPTDIGIPLRNLTYNRKWFGSGKDKGTYTINWLGESEVGKMSTGAVK